jgi:hypothetical protein
MKTSMVSWSCQEGLGRLADISDHPFRPDYIEDEISP